MEAPKVIYYHTEKGGQRPALLLKVGRKRAHILRLTDDGVKVYRPPKSHLCYCRALEHNGQPYPVQKAVQHFEEIGRRRGITKDAKEALKEVKSL